MWKHFYLVQGRSPGRCLVTLVAAFFALVSATPAVWAEPLPILWYTSKAAESPAAIAADGVHRSIMYGGTLDAMKAYLAACHAAGVRPIPAISPADVGAVDADRLAAHIDALESYATDTLGDPDLIAGWYLYDEPDTLTSAPDGFTPAEAAAAYAAVKARTAKPVYANIDADESVDLPGTADNQTLYKDSYDVNTTHLYPLARPSREFEGLDAGHASSTYLGWKFWMTRSRDNAAANGKRWVPVIQAYGNTKFNLRLPTAAELRFMTYFNVHLGADGLAYWRKERSTESVAQPGAPYERDGVAWNTEVFRPLMDELNTLAPAIGAGPVDGAVHTTGPGVLAKVYRDPADGIRYLLTLNPGPAAATGTFTLTGPASDAARLVELAAPGRTLGVTDHTVTTDFQPYEARNFRLAGP